MIITDITVKIAIFNVGIYFLYIITVKAVILG